jgi:DNA damage-inducible protein 1
MSRHSILTCLKHVLLNYHYFVRRIGNTYLTCSFTVIENSEMDLLVGLDVLRKYECEISLRRNSMVFSAAGVAQEVAFLTRLELEDEATDKLQQQQQQQ